MIKTKFRLEAILLIVFSSIGLAVFLAGPVMTADNHFVGSSGAGSYDYTKHIELRYDGYYKCHTEGVIYGETVDDISYQEPDVWDQSYGFAMPYPMVVKFMTSISLGLCFAAGIVSLFGDDKKFKLIGSIMGIVFGIMAVVGPFLVLNFTNEFRSYYESLVPGDPYEVKIGISFLFPIIFGSLCLISSIVLLVVKPLLLVPREKETTA